MKKNKKAIGLSFLFGLILLIGVAIYLLFFSSSFFSGGVIDTIECSNALNSLVLTGQLNSGAAESVISTKCNSHSVTVEQDSTLQASTLLETCWQKYGSGDYEFLTEQRNNICIYCGSISAQEQLNLQEEVFEELTSELPEKLFVDTNSMNYNKYYLENKGELLLSSVSEQEKLDVFFVSAYFPCTEEGCLSSEWNDLLETFTPVDSVNLAYRNQGYEVLSGIFTTVLDSGVEIDEGNRLEFEVLNRNLRCDNIIIPEPQELES